MSHLEMAYKNEKVEVDLQLQVALIDRLTDARIGNRPRIRQPTWNPSVDDDNIIPPLPPDMAKKVKLIRGPNILPPLQLNPIPPVFTGRVAIVLEDGASTGDMAPDGAIGMSLWSSIPEFARFLFRRQDPYFTERISKVGRRNYRGWP